jgi:hypothetical protein
MTCASSRDATPNACQVSSSRSLVMLGTLSPAPDEH